MAVDDAFIGLAPHTVTITPMATRNNYGETATSGTARTAKAYVEVDVAFNQGDQINESHHAGVTAYIFDTDILITDAILFPDGTTPKITSVAVYDFVCGLEHTLVRFA